MSSAPPLNCPMAPFARLAYGYRWSSMPSGPELSPPAG